MSGFRLAPEAEAQLDGIWRHIAGETGTVDTANRVVDNITDRFWLLAKHPFMGRKRDDLAPGLRSFVVGDYVIIHRIEGIEDDRTVFISFVFHGSQDIESFFSH
jgi:toxin ParE1/3/4